MSMSSLKTLFNSQQKFELLSWVMCKFKLAFLWNKLGWRTYPLCSVLGKNSRHLPWEYSTVRWWLPGRGRRRRRGAPGTWRGGIPRCWVRWGRPASPGGRSRSGRRTGRSPLWRPRRSCHFSPGHRGTPVMNQGVVLQGKYFYLLFSFILWCYIK